MSRKFSIAALALLICFAPAQAAAITGAYVEARTCDIWTGPCFANAESNLTGKNAVMGWKVNQGSLDNVSLDGLSIVAVIAASDTLGLEQTGPSKALLIVDSKANASQREALIRFAKQQGGKLLENVIAVESAPINLDLCPCKENGCAELVAGQARIRTRCLNAEHDKVCGNETAYYPPLVKGVAVRPAAAEEHSFRGDALRNIWSENNRRGAYVGTFEVR